MGIVKYKNRINTNCEKWDGLKEKFGKEDLLPLWVADMDFEVAEPIKKALHKYIDDGVYGYYKIPDEYYDAFINWEKERHNIVINKEWIRFSPGVVAGINWILQIFTEVGDSVLTIVPVYYPFQDAVNNNKRKLVMSELIRDRDNNFVINYEDIENKIIENNIKLIIFSSPHNPVGRVWEKEEIIKLFDICKKHNVYFISDEIHHDILMRGYKHTSIINLDKYDDITFVFTSTSKTFNLAGFRNSFLIIKNKNNRDKYDEYFNKLRISSGASVGYIAAIAAYTTGGEWFDEVLEIIENNYKYVCDELLKKFPLLDIAKLEGTYLMWIGLDKYIKNESISDLIENKMKIAIDYGAWFGSEKYKNYIRVNLATSKENINKFVEVFIKVIESLL